MKIFVVIISICLPFSLLGAGCSKEEQPLPPVKETKVVKRIIKPAPKEPETSIPSEAAKAEPKEKKVEEIKTAAVEEKAEKISVPKTAEKVQAKEEKGYYVVKSDESLSSISGREDVYGDPMKWPILYRLNLDKLDKMGLGEDFPEREISEGIRMKFLTPDEKGENLKNRGQKFWVVNILSATTKKDIVLSAIRLIKNGYPVYITTARVSGKDWMRLRLGFFKNKAEADAKGKQAMAVLKFSDSWTTKIGPKEFEEFGGY